MMSLRSHLHFLFDETHGDDIINKPRVKLGAKVAVNSDEIVVKVDDEIGDKTDDETEIKMRQNYFASH